MGKIYTYINKDGVNSKCKTSELNNYLNNGWQLGWPDLRDHMIHMSEIAANKLKNLKENNQEEYINYQKKRGEVLSRSMKTLWDNMTENDKALREEHRLSTRDAWTEEQKQQYSENMSKAAKANRATITEEEYHRRSILATETKKKNKTFAVSSFENITKNLLILTYGEDDLIFDDYVDSRYSTKCDFYIKSQDIFIELNMHPSHGEHLFNVNDKKDIELKEYLQTNTNAWSNMILDVWANRDIKKFEEARKNKLNYIAIYPNNFDIFIQTIKEGNIWSLVK